MPLGTAARVAVMAIVAMVVVRAKCVAMCDANMPTKQFVRPCPWNCRRDTRVAGKALTRASAALELRRGSCLTPVVRP